MNVSVRAGEKLTAAGVEVSYGDHCPTGHELVRDLLRPIAELAELAPRIRYGVRVLEIGRDGLLKSDEIGTAKRGEMPFRILFERGRSGIHAPGERAVDDSIVREVPEVIANQSDWVDQRILLVEAGHSVQTAAGDLAELCLRQPDTEVIWAMRSQAPTLGEVDNDPRPERGARPGPDRCGDEPPRRGSRDRGSPRPLRRAVTENFYGHRGDASQLSD